MSRNKLTDLNAQKPQGRKLTDLGERTRDVTHFVEADRAAIRDLLNAYVFGKVRSAETVNGYVRSLQGISQKCLLSGKSLLAAISDNPTALRACLRRKVPVLSTYTTTLNGILALFNHASGSVSDGHEVQAFWRAEQKDAHAALVEKNKNNVVTDTMRVKEFKLHELDKAIDLARADVKRGQPENAHTAPGTEAQQLLWLVIARHVPPHRRDYGDMRIVYALKEVRENENAMVLPRGNATKARATLVLNRYKTARHYERFTQRMPEIVTTEIGSSLKALPRKYLFVKRGTEPMGDEYFGFWARKAFEKYLRKDATLNSLRRAWVAWISDPTNNFTLAEREKYAREMNHSLQTQIMSYSKVDRG